MRGINQMQAEKGQIEYIIGVDISQKSLDVYSIRKSDGQEHFRGSYKNTKRGFLKFMGENCKEKTKVQVVLEATGNYHYQFVVFLEKEGIAKSILNPLSVKRYAQMKFKRTKTDKLDAEVIACYGYDQHPPVDELPSKEQQKLRSLLTALEQMIKQRSQTKNLLHAEEKLLPESKDAVREIKGSLRDIDKRIKKLEEKIKEIILAHYRELYEYITSIPGIGIRTACAVIAYCGDLSRFASPKQIIAYVGTSPQIRQSGSSLRKTGGISKQGNARLRTLFYLGALSAVQWNQSCKAMYIRLLKKGKKKKTALIAVANKLIKQLFAIVRDKTYFSNDYCIR
jgi:transposase